MNLSERDTFLTVIKDKLLVANDDLSMLIVTWSKTT